MNLVKGPQKSAFFIKESSKDPNFVKGLQKKSEFHQRIVKKKYFQKVPQKMKTRISSKGHTKKNKIREKFSEVTKWLDYNKHTHICLWLQVQFNIK